MNVCSLVCGMYECLSENTSIHVKSGHKSHKSAHKSTQQFKHLKCDWINYRQKFLLRGGLEAAALSNVSSVGLLWQRAVASGRCLLLLQIWTILYTLDIINASPPYTPKVPKLSWSIYQTISISITNCVSLPVDFDFYNPINPTVNPNFNNPAQ